MPASSASSTARLDGAETAASVGIPAIIAFWVSSKLARPLTISTQPDSGSRSCAGGPADDLVDRVVPADVLAHDQQLALGGEQAGRVQPAGAVEHLLVRPQRLRHPGEHAGGGPTGSVVHGVAASGCARRRCSPCRRRRRSWWCRARGPSRAAAASRPAARVTSTTLYVGLPSSSSSQAVHQRRPRPSPRRSAPSVSRKPRARSKSSPGVRIVTASEVPADPDLQRLLDGHRVGPGDHERCLRVAEVQPDGRRALGDPSHSASLCRGVRRCRGTPRRAPARRTGMPTVPTRIHRLVLRAAVVSAAGGLVLGLGACGQGTPAGTSSGTGSASVTGPPSGPRRRRRPATTPSPTGKAPSPSVSSTALPQHEEVSALGRIVEGLRPQCVVLQTSKRRYVLTGVRGRGPARRPAGGGGGGAPSGPDEPLRRHPRRLARGAAVTTDPGAVCAAPGSSADAGRSAQCRRRWAPLTPLKKPAPLGVPTPVTSS